MSLIHIPVFKGEVPRKANRKIVPSFAQIARNCDLWSGELRPLRNNLRVATPTKTGEIQTIYPLNGKWLHWITDVDVVRSSLQLELDDGRIYYTGDHQPKSTNNDLATAGFGTDYPLAWYRLGLPAPETGPTVGITGGSTGIAETRSYVYTFVTEWGEEGPPSPITEYIAANDDATSWDLSGIDVSPLNDGVISGATYNLGIVTVTVTAKHFLETGDWLDIADVVGMTDLNDRFQITRLTSTTFSVELTTAQSYISGGTWARESAINVTDMTKRIYRTISSQFRYVDEIPAAQTTYTDTKEDDLVILNELIPSTNWISPPVDLVGLITLPNGSLAGHYKNIVTFSPPYQPHAWPADYEISFPFNVVAIASFGNNILVATDGDPYMVVGYHPEVMSEGRLEIHQACVSKRSMSSVLNGAIYASPDGLVYVPGAGVPRLITREWMKKSDWDLVNPSSMIGIVYDDRYYGFYTGGTENDNESGAIVFDPVEQDSTFTRIDLFANAVHVEPDDDSLFLYLTPHVEQWTFGGNYLVYTWKSGIFVIKVPEPLTVGKVRLTAGDAIPVDEHEEAIAGAVEGVDDAIANFQEENDGTFGGYFCGQYMVAGGPYIDAVEEAGGELTEEGQTQFLEAYIKIYKNGEMFFEKLILDNKPFRMPGGIRGDEYEIELSGNNVKIHEVILASTMGELSAV